MCINKALNHVVEFSCLYIEFFVALRVRIAVSCSLKSKEQFPSYLCIGEWRSWLAVSVLELFYRVEVTSVDYPPVFKQEFFTQVRLVFVELAQVIPRSHRRLSLRILESRAYSCSLACCEILF
jgi:hypothetical protein